MSTNRERLEHLEEMRLASREGGGAARVAKQHDAGKLTRLMRAEMRGSFGLQVLVGLVESGEKHAPRSDVFMKFLFRSARSVSGTE